MNLIHAMASTNRVWLIFKRYGLLWGLKSFSGSYSSIQHHYIYSRVKEQLLLFFMWRMWRRQIKEQPQMKNIWQTRRNVGHLPLSRDVTPRLAHGIWILCVKAKLVANLENREWQPKVVHTLIQANVLMVLCAEINLCLGMPSEVKAVGLTGHRQREGQSIMIDYVIAYIVQLCIQTWGDITLNLVSLKSHSECCTSTTV